MSNLKKAGGAAQKSDGREEGSASLKKAGVLHRRAMGGKRAVPVSKRRGCCTEERWREEGSASAQNKEMGIERGNTGGESSVQAADQNNNGRDGATHAQGKEEEGKAQREKKGVQYRAQGKNREKGKTRGKEYQCKWGEKRPRQRKKRTKA